MSPGRVRRRPPGPSRILTGIEWDIHLDGSLDQTDELLGRLDVVVASVHSDLRAESAAMTERMLAPVANPHTDVLGHCTGRLLNPQEQPTRARTHRREVTLRDHRRRRGRGGDPYG
jgi:putative hydrolase